MTSDPIDPAEDAPTVCIVDDDAAVRLSVDLLVRTTGIRTRSFASAMALLEDRAALEQADCLILDIRMPGISGLVLQETLNSLGRKIPTIFVTGHGDIPQAVRAMRHGATDFLQKPFNDQALLDAVQACILQSRRLKANGARTNALDDKLASLSQRERQVLEFLLEGHSNKTMARLLGISIKTVENHRARVMDKLGAPSLVALVRLLEQHRLSSTKDQ